jgi:hypothetical protein
MSAAKELLWWRRILKDMAIETETPVLYCDNKQTVDILKSETPKINTKLRHVEIAGQWLRQTVQTKLIDLRWISTSQMVADGLTKSLSPQQHTKFVEMLGLTDVEDLIMAKP